METTVTLSARTRRGKLIATTVAALAILTGFGLQFGRTLPAVAHSTACPRQDPQTQPSSSPRAVAQNYNFRSSPHLLDCNVIRILPPDTRVTVLNDENQYVFVRVDVTQETGWIFETGLRNRRDEPLKAAGSPTANIVTASHGTCAIRVDSSIQENVEALLADAAVAGHTSLCGGGWRSSDVQANLRRRHCASAGQEATYYDIYEKPARECRPPTAPPGKSNHEKGLAIDFTSGSSDLSAAQFAWLAANAADYGLYNYPRERWHWSVDGS